MESLKPMHIKRFVAHLLTFRHTVYYRIWFFCRPFSEDRAGNITRQVTSLLLRASEVVTDFFMCITQPIAHLCGVWSAVLFYIEHEDAH